MNTNKRVLHVLSSFIACSVLVSGLIGCSPKDVDPSSSSAPGTSSQGGGTIEDTNSTNTDSVSSGDDGTSGDASSDSSRPNGGSSSNNGNTGGDTSSKPSDTAAARKDYYVSPSGNDSNPGTKEKPLKTIACALETVNKYKSQVKDNMSIILATGTYYLDSTLKIDQSYNLPNNKTLTIKADKNARPVISGGKQITGWKKVTVNGIQMYKANVSGLKYGRSFYVNEKPMMLAASTNDYTHASTGKYSDWGWAADNKYNAITVPSHDLTTIKNIKQLEVVWHCEWKTFLKRADRISNNSIVMRQPDWDWAMTPQMVGNNDTSNPNYWNWYPDPRNPNQEIYLQNDVSLIDTPGEFCYDEAEKAMYFYPEKGVDPNKAVCVVSNLDEMIQIVGDSAKRVQHIVFDGLVMGYGGFDLMGDHGMATEQNQHYISDVTTGNATAGNNQVVNIPDAYYKGNILIDNAKDISFLNCTYMNSDKGIHFDLGVENAKVQGCVFKDLGDSAVVIGNGHAAYKMGKERTTGVVIDNNVIRRIGKVNHSVPAICAFFSNTTTISHNDIYDVPYTGISVGWGWYVVLNSDYAQKNVIEYNRVGKFMTTVRDGGGIYTLGQQSNSVCRYNYIYDQHEAYGGIYHDEGTAGYTTTDNVVENFSASRPNQVWLCLNGFPVKLGSNRMTVYGLTIKNNYYNNTNIINNGDMQTIKGLAENIYVSGNNWPDAAKKIIANSGVTEQYKGLLNK